MILLFTSCKKKEDDGLNPSAAVNKPPVADAGPDQTITLPASTITLNGNGSSDPENNIRNFAWTKVSGPTFFTIADATVAQTLVINLVEGVYQYELKVTDAVGLVDKDTVQVTVNALTVCR